MNAASKTNRVARLGGVATALLLSCCNPAAASEAKGHGDVHAAPETANEAAHTASAGAASARNPAAHPEANKAASVPSPVEVNPAFRDASDDLASTNIVEKQADAPGSSKQADLDAMMDWARRMKREKNFEAAEKSFVMVLGADAPETMHRTALLEMGLMAQETQQHARAQQVFTQYLDRYPDDPSAAEVYLRQGLLYRQMGAPTMALSKFYAVMTTSMRLKLDRLDYYQRLVLQAQTEIADTYYLQGKFSEAGEFLGRLLKLDSPQLNKAQIIFKMIRSLSSMNKHTEVISRAEFFLTNYPDTVEVAEVRFLLADSLKKLGRAREATQQVLVLLESQQITSTNKPGNWIYWQQRTGNEIANQLYKEGDYLNALEIYQNLAKINDAASWQIPVWYQMGMIYERLMQPTKAAELYTKIIGREKELDSAKRTLSLDAVLDMARWRKENLKWQMKTEAINAAFHGAPDPAVALGAK
jgi:tetratricopeptide (TPR) repeat protein